MHFIQCKFSCIIHMKKIHTVCWRHMHLNFWAQFIIRIWCFPIMYWKVSGWKLCLPGQKFLHTHKTLAKCTTSIALSFDSLLLRGISAGPCFRASHGRAWRPVCLPCRARMQKQGPALTSCNNRLSNERAMTTSKQLMSEKPSTP